MPTPGDPRDPVADVAYERTARRDDVLIEVEQLARPWRQLADDAREADLLVLDARLDGASVNPRLSGPLRQIAAIAERPVELAELVQTCINDPSLPNRRALTDATTLPQARAVIAAPADQLGPLGIDLIERVTIRLPLGAQALGEPLDALRDRIDEQITGRVPFPSQPATAAERQQVFREQLLIEDIADRIEPTCDMALQLMPERSPVSKPPVHGPKDGLESIVRQHSGPSAPASSIALPSAANQNLRLPIANEGPVWQMAADSIAPDADIAPMVGVYHSLAAAYQDHIERDQGSNTQRGIDAASPSTSPVPATRPAASDIASLTPPGAESGASSSAGPSTSGRGRGGRD